MSNYDPRLFHQLHGTHVHPHVPIINPRYGTLHPTVSGNPATSIQQQQLIANNTVPRGVPGQPKNGSTMGLEDATKKKATGVGTGSWENMYKTAQRIPFPDTRSGCGQRVGEFVEDLARSIGCPVEYVLVPLLPCIGGLLGTNTTVNVHRAWSEPLVLWSVVGAPPGSRRSAVIRQLLSPILQLQSRNDQQTVADATNPVIINPSHRALYSGTRITLPAITEVLHRNDGHAFSLTENVENLHDMLGLLQPIPAPRLISVVEDLYEGLPLVAVENGRVTTITGSNFCHGGFSSQEYIVNVLMKCPSWLSSRLLLSCPVADHTKGVFGEADNDIEFPSLEIVYTILFDTHKSNPCRYIFNKDAVQELSRFFDEEWSSVLTQLEQNEHEALIGKSMGQIVRICGILKALENAISAAGDDISDTKISDKWDWIIDVDTVQCAIKLGKYFLEQKLAVTFMVGTGFFSNSGPIDEENESMSGSQDQEYSDSPTTLPQTAFDEDSNSNLNSSSNNNAQSNISTHCSCDTSASGTNNRSTDQNDIFNELNENSEVQRNINEIFRECGIRRKDNTSNSGQIAERSYRSNRMNEAQNNPLAQLQQMNTSQHFPSSSTSTSTKPISSTMNQQSSHQHQSQSQINTSKLKSDTETDVDFSHLPSVMTTREEDMSEMMQVVDFVHFSKTQFVAVHGRRIKRLLECYDDGHGVSATTAAQKSITPPVKIQGTNNRHPAWASALFFQKVAELELGIAEQGRHPTNRKVCWRFKRKPVNQLSNKDNQLLHYLRIDMEKYSHFGSVFNPTMMVNSGLISLGQSNSNSNIGSPNSSPVNDDSGPPFNNGQSRNSMSTTVKSEIF